MPEARQEWFRTHGYDGNPFASMITTSPSGRFIVAAAMDQELAPLKSRAFSTCTSSRPALALRKRLEVLAVAWSKQERRLLSIDLLADFSRASSRRPVIGQNSSVQCHGTGPAELAVVEKVRLHNTCVHFGTLVTVDHVLGDSASKRSLAISPEGQEVRR
jgi:hypothetical protein